MSLKNEYKGFIIEMDAEEEPGAWIAFADVKELKGDVMVNVFPQIRKVFPRPGDGFINALAYVRKRAMSKIDRYLLRKKLISIFMRRKYN
jgi:hypothetical protein